MRITVKMIRQVGRLLASVTLVGLAQPSPAPPVRTSSDVIAWRVEHVLSGRETQCLVGRPTPELWDYLNARGYELPPHGESLLALYADGTPIADPNLASDVCHTAATYDALVPSLLGLKEAGSSSLAYLDEQITLNQQILDLVNKQIGLIPWFEPLMLIRDEAARGILFVIEFKLMFALASHPIAFKADAAAMKATASAMVCDALSRGSAIVAQDVAPDSLICGPAAQRKMCARLYQLLADAHGVQLRELRRLRDSRTMVCDEAFGELERSIHAIKDVSLPEFNSWATSVFAGGNDFFEIGANTVNVSERIGQDFLKAGINAFTDAASGTSVLVPCLDLKQALASEKQVAMGGIITTKRAFSLEWTDAYWKLVWEPALRSGLLDDPRLKEKKMDRYARAVARNYAEGGYYEQIAARHWSAPSFHMAMLREYFSPGPITTLVAQPAQYSTVHLRWAAPAAEMGVKSVANHQIRYSDAPIQTEPDWARAIRVEKETGPAVPGAAVNVVTDDLPAGRTFFFAVRAVDDQGNVGPISNTPSVEVGHGINPIGLGEATVSPNPGSAIAGRHRYEVSYIHQGGLAAGKSYLFVNGQPHSLDLMPGGNPKEGLRYAITDTTSYLPGSTVRYHFEFETGPHSRRLPEAGELELPVDPVLYGNTVNPAQANQVTLRTFQVTYRHPFGKPPVRSHLRLANTSPITMRLLRGAPTIGALYEGAAWVSTLNQEYWFDFSDGTLDYRLPLDGAFRAAVESNLDVAILRCPMPDKVTCGQVIPIRPVLRNMGTQLAQNCGVYFVVDDVTNLVIVPVIGPGMSLGGAASFDWTVPVSDAARSYKVRVGISPLAGETATDNNELVFEYNIAPGKGAISGSVLGSDNIIPIPGVVVQAVGGTTDASHAVTDDNGFFKIDGLQAGEYRVWGENDGQRFETTGVVVNALATNNIGPRSLSGYGLSQHSFFTGNNNMRAVMVSPFDGMVAYRCGSNRGLYLMKPDGTNPHQFFSDSPTLPSVYPPETVSFSPIRREFVFMGYRSKTDQWGIFRCTYDADGNFVDCTFILDANSFTNPYGISNPTFLPSGEDLIFFEDSPTDALWQMSRTGSGLQRKVFPANTHGQTYYYSMSPDGRYLVTSEYVYSLDLPSGTLTNVWAMPADALGGYIPMFTPDSTRILYTKQVGGYNDIFAVEPFTTSTPMQVTFENRRDQNGILSRDAKTMYYVRTTIDDASNYQLWSRAIEWPAIYAYNIYLSQGEWRSVGNPITLDGDGTNDVTTLYFTLSTSGLVSAKVYDCQNRLVRSLCEGRPMNAGTNSVTWNGADEYDFAVPFGVYSLRLSIATEGGVDRPAFTSRMHIPVVYETATLTDGSKGWVAFTPDGRSLYYADRLNDLYRLDLTASNAAPVGIQNVKAFDVNGQHILVMATNATGKYDFKWYSTNGSFLATWVAGVSQDIVPPAYCSTFPAVHPAAQEFVYADQIFENVGGDNIDHWNVYKCTGLGSTAALTTATNHEFAAAYDTTGTTILYAAGAGFSQPANIYEMNTSGGGVVQRTTHPRYEFMPKSVPGCSRLAFAANWALSGHELWTADRSGGNPWWLLPAFDACSGNYSISSNADLLAYAWPAVKLAALPEHLNKGSIRGRAIDDTFGAGLPDVTVRAVREGFIVASTRSNARGYYKLINVPAGNWDVVAGGGLFLEVFATNVTVAAAQVAETASISVVPVPTATIVEPAPNSIVGPSFDLKVEPSERCVSARVEWRRSTSGSWVLAGILTADQLFATNFPAALTDWTAGEYVLKATGVNAGGVPDPNPSQVTVTFQPSSPSLILTLNAGDGAKLAALRTAKPGPETDVAVQVFEMKPPGAADWVEMGTIVSEEGAEKQVSPARVLAGTTTQFRVRSYDRVGNESVSSILSHTNVIPGDRDADGMPDDWEQRYGLNPDSPTDGSMDADGDGLSNLQEYLLQLDPRQVDAPRISAITAGSGGTIHLCIEGVSGRVIAVEVSEDLTNWSACADPVLAESSVELHVPTPTGTSYGFYRVVLR